MTVCLNYFFANTGKQHTEYQLPKRNNEYPLDIAIYINGIRRFPGKDYSYSPFTGDVRLMPICAYPSAHMVIDAVFLE